MRNTASGGRPASAHCSRAKEATSPARVAAAAILDSRGNSPRRYRNTLVFLAADKTRLTELESAVRQYLAWRSIETEAEGLNLDAFGARQARTQRERTDEAIRGRIPETYCWALVPTLHDPQASAATPEWEERRLQGQDALAPRASRRLRDEELLLTGFGGIRLRMELDRIPLWRGDHVALRQLAEDFAQYLYLPRLRDDEVLLAAVRDGVASLFWEQETFAYAEQYDERAGRYAGLRVQEQIAPTLESGSVLVKPEVAAAQRAGDTGRPATGPLVYPQPGGGADTHQVGETTGSDSGDTALPPAPQVQRFYGAVTLRPERPARDAAEIAEAVIAHLTGLVGAEVTITLEIHASLPHGASEQIVRTVSENCHSLRFKDYGFEER